ncbi:MAG: bifunctional DedA family/phosphatase PAP2 family protein [Pseudomonadota bacterium]|nr:bifunctional DedA family/phosphatase PAP2 family protein [Pseudomonadota bacterium]
MQDYLINLLSQLGHWGYLIVFSVATLECAAFLGLIVPGETIVLVAGFFASRGFLGIGNLIVLVAAGAIIGDSIGYELGRRFGRSWLLSASRWVGLRNSHLARVDAFFMRHGGKAVLLGRFVGFARALVPFVAGASEMPYRHFLPYNAFGGILWSISFGLLGYFLGASWQLAEHWIGPASAVAGGIFLAVIALVWLWRWLIHHELGIKRRWTMLLQRPRIVAFRHRFAPQFAFIHTRFSPGSYLGLHLTLGTLALSVSAWLFGGIAEDVVTGDPLTVVDIQVAAWLHAHTDPPVIAVMSFISSLGSIPVVSAIAVITALLLGWRRHWYRLLSLALTVPGGILLNILLKYAFHRLRPTFENPIVVLTSYSFPSTHTMAATVLYGALATFAVGFLKEWRWRTLVVLATILLVALIGFSRMYLGVHYLSDVLAAIAEGVAWLALCLTGVRTVQLWRQASTSDPTWFITNDSPPSQWERH